ncbi:GHKL domain-containing protein [Cetobacterium somerae]|uniref:sensor histidine kinase n=1 Tax=Cetobacterium sp. NK01 TaxID=2993530 RepID=UPI0021161B8E|nr:ATP-binding protein [Cetobacterium sp. NK01]MCQ8213540.1 GHKL domain-containing protein [Cetobacterium sp. NK01]
MKSRFEQRVIKLSILITTPLLILLIGIITYTEVNNETNKVKRSLNEVALEISDTRFVKESIISKKFNLQKYAEVFVDNNQDVDIVVIADKNNLRFSHLDPSKIGETFGTKDSENVLKNKKGYFIITKGSQGLTYRRFEPIVEDDKIIGFVMVGKLFNIFKHTIFLILLKILVLSLISSIFIFISSKIFAKKIKKEMLDLEPEEITKLYINTKSLVQQQAAIIDNIHEGVVVLNSTFEIININKKVFEILHEFEINSFIEKFSNIFYEKKNIYFKEIKVGHEKVFVCIIHLLEEKTHLGVIITFYKHIEIINLAKELTSINNVINGFRENNHEFKNQLQVISGLIQLKKYDLVQEYMKNLENSNMKILTEIANISDYYILGILIGKFSVIKEKGILFTIDQDSVLFREHGSITSLDIITIVSNLLENAIEALEKSKTENKQIELLLLEDEDSIQITVFDNGLKIDPIIKEKMFERYVSSKGENRGIGLSLVKSKIELYNGRFILEEVEGGKYFTIILNKENSNDIQGINC